MTSSAVLRGALVALCVRCAAGAGSVVVGEASELRRRELSGGSRSAACASGVQRKAVELVEEARAYGWCDLKRDLRGSVLWYDDSASYSFALYGPHRWGGGGYGVVVGLSQRIVFAVVSILGNARVVLYHWLTPAHPKFTLDPLNRLAVKAHVFAGSLNVFFPVVAFFVAPALGRSLMWVVAALEVVHCATALRMMPNVFGCKVLMTPGRAARVRARPPGGPRGLREEDPLFLFETT